jgi:hypothetical protein
VRACCPPSPPMCPASCTPPPPPLCRWGTYRRTPVRRCCGCGWQHGLSSQVPSTWTQPWPTHRMTPSRCLAPAPPAATTIEPGATVSMAAGLANRWAATVSWAWLIVVSMGQRAPCRGQHRAGTLQGTASCGTAWHAGRTSTCLQCAAPPRLQGLCWGWACIQGDCSQPRQLHQLTFTCTALALVADCRVIGRHAMDACIDDEYAGWVDCGVGSLGLLPSGTAVMELALPSNSHGGARLSEVRGGLRGMWAKWARQVGCGALGPCCAACPMSLTSTHAVVPSSRLEPATWPSSQGKQLSQPGHWSR